jgi:exosome complex component RRP41
LVGRVAHDHTNHGGEAVCKAPFSTGMSRRAEYLSPEGLRIDGRRAAEIRRLRCRMGVLQADGSAYVEQGNTKVLVSVCGPREMARRKATAHDRASLTVEFSAMPYATGEHKPQSHGDRSAAELSAAVRRIFEPVVQLQLYPRSQINVSITLLQADGGVRSAAINATSLALIDAGVALEDIVCGCSAGSVHGALLLDLNAQEDGAGAELSVSYLPRTERVCFVQLESKVPLGAVEEVMNFALQGCRQVHEVLSAAVELRMQETLASRGVQSNS